MRRLLVVAVLITSVAAAPALSRPTHRAHHAVAKRDARYHCHPATFGRGPLLDVSILITTR